MAGFVEASVLFLGCTVLVQISAGLNFIKEAYGSPAADRESTSASRTIPVIHSRSIVLDS